MTTAGADIEPVYHARRLPALRAVLFDLDDTLFDHEESARAALAVVRQGFTCFQRLAPAAFEGTHAALLDALHSRVIAGEIGIDEARVERFRRLFEVTGEPDSAGHARAAARCYRAAYLAARRPVAGAAALLAALHARVRIGVVSNNLRDEQREKLEYCGLAAHVRVLVVSEEARVSKPDPAIFQIALERLGCAPEEAVMVGDSWVHDVTGALDAGIAAVWFNRRSAACPDPRRGAVELHALEPVRAAVQVIHDAHRQAAGRRR